MSTETIVAVLSKPCTWCSGATAALAELRRKLQDGRNVGLFLTARRTDHENQPFDEPMRVASLAVVCRKCNGTGRELTKEGADLVKLLVEAGVITGAELDKRLNLKGEGDGEGF